VVSLIQKSFAKGEITPALAARSDQTAYATGLRTCRNFLVQRFGGVTNRPGTQYVCEVNDSSKTVRLVKFVFDADQTFVLEFGNEYIRFIQDGAQVVESSVAVTGATAANPLVITAVAHGFDTGDEVVISAVGGMTQINNKNFKILSLTADTFSLQTMAGVDVNGIGYTAYTSGGIAERVYTIDSPYVEADLSTLQYTQSADVVTIVHPNYPPMELARVSNTEWTLTAINFEPSIDAPTGASASGSAGTHTYRYRVTAIAEETAEESLPSATASATSTLTPSSSDPVTVSWSAVSGAQEYDVYRYLNGVYGFIGVANGTSFDDIGYTPDTTDTPPEDRDIFDSTDDYPSAVGYFQQRLILAGTNNDPEKVWTSQTGSFHNFLLSTPIQDDGPVTFTPSGRRVNAIRSVLDLGKLILFTAGGVHAALGDASGSLTPLAINLRQQGYVGASTLPPIPIGQSALFVQSMGSVVHDLVFDFQTDGYKGDELSLFAAHLFDGYTLVDWDYQETPHSIVWAVRDDGTLLGLTYLRSQQIAGWHRHDTQNGTFENVVSVPEDDEDAVYVVVKRTINGLTKRYIERFHTRTVTDIAVDAFFVDCGLTYDGRNTGSTTMTLSGGSTWAHTETLTLTASAATFSASDVGNAVAFYIRANDATDTEYDTIFCTITAYTSSTVVSVQADKDVPAGFQSIAFTDWALAVDEVSNLDHLEGQTVAILADGNEETQLTVSSGAITLPRPYAVIHVGLPIEADIETLSLDIVSGETLLDKRKLINKVTVVVDESRGMSVGPDEDHLTDQDPIHSTNYADPIPLYTGNVEVLTDATWENNARTFIRQSSPLPVTVLAIIPSGRVGG
jgi:hypothetical protein